MINSTPCPLLKIKYGVALIPSAIKDWKRGIPTLLLNLGEISWILIAPITHRNGYSLAIAR